MTHDAQARLIQIFKQRYSDPPEPADLIAEADRLQSMAARGSCRSFKDEHVPSEVIDILCATAMAAPTKSDLQQRDIVVLKSKAQRDALAALVPGQPWVLNAPMIAVFCGNNRRQRIMHQHHDVPFANDHLDALFNAIGDAAIALSTFITAAEAIGLGCCPISAVRNEATKVSELLQLPDHVFPFAGLAFGIPSQKPAVSKRLALGVTCHTDTYQERDLITEIEAYDRWRVQSQPYGSQRFPDKFPASAQYTWSEDKVRQYSEPERDSFGAYIRSIGFNLK